MLQIRIQMNTNLQQSSWILPVTNLLVLRKMKETNIPFWNCRLPTKPKVLIALTEAISFITHPPNLKFHPYVKYQSVPIISYVYTRPIASKKINYKHVLRDLNIDDFKSKPPDCTCASSPFIYNPTGHVITGDLRIINNTSQREVFAKRA